MLQKFLKKILNSILEVSKIFWKLLTWSRTYIEFFGISWDVIEKLKICHIVFLQTFYIKILDRFLVKCKEVWQSDIFY